MTIKDAVIEKYTEPKGLSDTWVINHLGNNKAGWSFGKQEQDVPVTSLERSDDTPFEQQILA